MDSSIRFEPMTVGMILDATIRIFSEHYWMLWGIWAAAWVPQLLVLILWEAWTFLGDEWSLPLIGATILFYAVWVVALAPLAAGAAMAAVSQAYLGGVPDIRLAFQAAWRRALPLIGVNLAVFLIILVGFFLLFVPGVILWLGLSVGAPVVLFEGVAWDRAIERSWSLTRDHRLRILGALMIVVFFQAVVQFGAVGCLAILGMGIQSLPSQILQRLAGLVLAPLGSIVVILIYYDLRIRKEGFDLELLSQAPPESPLGLGPMEGA